MANNAKNVRRCIICRAHDDKANMIRFVRKDGVAVVDDSKQLDGRGAWVHNSEDCIAKLKKRKPLASILGCKVDDQLYEQL